MAVEWLEFEADGDLDAVNSETPAWKVIDYTPLRRRTRVGENRPVDGSPGRIPVDRQWDEHRLTLTWKINGKRDRLGVAHTDPVLGVDVNHDYLLEHVINVLTERAVTFHKRDGSTPSGTVYVDDWDPAPDPNSGGDFLVASMTLVIPAGWLS